MQFQAIQDKSVIFQNIYGREKISGFSVISEQVRGLSTHQHTAKNRFTLDSVTMLPVLGHCWLQGRKGVLPLEKLECW